jgi:hypothetical protein
VSFALIFFRSADITASLGYIQKLFTDLVIHPGQLFLLPKHYSSLIYVLLLIAIDLTKYMNWFMGKPVYRFYLHAAADIILIFTTISYLFRVDSASFIYFQF